MRKTFGHRPYAVICIHKDNDKDFQVIEYFYDVNDAFDFADSMNSKNHNNCIYEVAKYD